MDAFRKEHPQFPVSSLCEKLGVARSWFYARPDAVARQAGKTAVLRDMVEPVVLMFSGYGYRRVTHQLRRDGQTVNGKPINHKRVLRVMRQEGLLCNPRKRFVTTTDSSHRLERFPNLLKGATICRPHQAWVADITYIRLPQGFVFLAAILDAFTRLCPGWALSRHIDTRLTLAALEKALGQRRPEPDWIHHSDQGVQYASRDYVLRLTRAGARPSMSRRGNPYDNAQAESFIKTLKREEVHIKQYQDYEDAQANIGAFIDAVYNQKRLHSSLGYMPPAEFESQFESELEATQTTE